MVKIKNFFENRIRRLVQLISLGVIGEWSFYGIFRCPFAVPYVSCGNCPVVQCPGINLWMWGWVLIGVSALVFGRFFCSYVCPGYLVSEFLALFSVLKNLIRGLAVKIISFIRYILVGFSLYYTFILMNPRWAVPIRTGEFWGSVGLTFEHASPLWLYRTAFILAGLGLGLIIPMFWCRFVCPTGGILELISRFSLFKYTMTPSCTECGKCRDRCAMDTRPSEINCTSCGDCVPSCAPKAIELIKSSS